MELDKRQFLLGAQADHRVGGHDTVALLGVFDPVEGLSPKHRRPPPKQSDLPSDSRRCLLLIPGYHDRPDPGPPEGLDGRGNPLPWRVFEGNETEEAKIPVQLFPGKLPGIIHRSEVPDRQSEDPHTVGRHGAVAILHLPPDLLVYVLRILGIAPRRVGCRDAEDRLGRALYRGEGAGGTLVDRRHQRQVGVEGNFLHPGGLFEEARLAHPGGGSRLEERLLHRFSGLLRGGPFRTEGPDGQRPG